MASVEQPSLRGTKQSAVYNISSANIYVTSLRSYGTIVATFSVAANLTAVLLVFLLSEINILLFIPKMVILILLSIMINYKDYITIEPGKRSGKPCIRGMRITVYDVLSYLAAGMTIHEILEDFPQLTNEDIMACLAYAADAEKKMIIAA